MFPNMMPVNLRIEQRQRENELKWGALSSVDEGVRAELEARWSEEGAVSAKDEPQGRPANNRSLWRRLASLRLQHNP